MGRQALGEWLVAGRHAWRALRSRWAATVAVVAVAGVGVGIATVIFGLADPYGFRPLPYHDPDRLVRIQIGVDGVAPAAAVPTVEEWQARKDLFEDLAAYEHGPTPTLHTAADGRIAFPLARVTDNFLRTLGVPGATAEWRHEPGRTLVPVVLTEAARTVSVEQSDRTLTGEANESYLVAGRVGDTFVFPGRPAESVPHGLVVYRPGPVMRTAVSSMDGQSRLDGVVVLIARLQPGVTPRTVQQVLSMLPDGSRLGIDVSTLSDVMTGRVRPLALGAVAAAVLLLAICAANVANIWLARGTYRLDDITTRRVLGASAWHIGRLLAAECLLISIAVCVLAVALAATVLSMAATMVPPEYATLGLPSLTTRGVWFAIGASMALVTLAMIPSVWLVCRTPAAASDSSSVRHTKGLRVWRFVFSTLQAMLAMILAIGAATLTQSAAALFAQQTGYDDRVFVMPVMYGVVAPRGSEIPDGIERLRRVPGVTAVAALYGAVANSGVSLRGIGVNGVQVMVDGADVTADYFDVVGTRLLRGRLLGPGDDARAAVVDQAFVDTYWPGENPLGRLITRGRTSLETVGVVSNVLQRGLAAPAQPTVYTLMSDVQMFPFLMTQYIVRVERVSTEYPALLKRAIGEIAPAATIRDVSTVGVRLADSIRDRSFATLVLGLFGVAGVLVCLAGTAGVVSFVVARRTREMAIRLALGAPVSHVGRLVVGEAMLAALAGGVSGLVAGRWLATGLESLVYGVEAGAWTTGVATAVVLLIAAAIAASIPAHRAMALAPAEALRVE